MKKNYKHLMIITIFLSVLFMMSLGSINIPKIFVFVFRGVETIGRITKLEPNNHASVSYAYNIGTVEYSGLTQGSGNGNPSFENLKINDKIKIFYDSFSPEKSMAGNPKSNLVNELIAILMAGILLPLVIFVFLRLKTDK